jgi:hypothetical protein
LWILSRPRGDPSGKGKEIRIGVEHKRAVTSTARLCLIG